jgi:hypothetical protein
VKLSISQHFHNKQNHAPMKRNKDGESNRWAMGAFNTVEWTPEQIAEHLRAGKAICVAALDGNWRGQANFVSSQLMGIDFDNGPDVETLVKNEFVKAYAFYVYPTPSHTPEKPRSRALFALDEPITDYDRYRVLITRLLHKLDMLNADPSCKDPVRIFYGSDVEGWRGKSLAKVLPVAVLDALPKTDDELLREQRAKEPPPPFKAETSAENKRAQAYSEAARRRILDDALSNNIEGHRHHAFITAVWQLVALEKGGWPGINAASDARYLAGVLDREDVLDNALKGAQRKVDPSWFELPEIKDPRVSNYVTPEPGKDAPPPPTIHWKSSDDALLMYDDQLVTPTKDELPLVFPFEALHPLGGLCHYIPLGKMIGVPGASGGMKTSFLETITDAWRKGQGVDVLWWGTEWTPVEMAARAIQRYGGATMDEAESHRIWLSEEERRINGETLTHRRGRRMPDDVLIKSNQISYTIRNKWPGKSHYMEEPVSDIDLLITKMNDRCDALRTAGRNVRVAVFDYLQLIDLYAARSEAERVTMVLGKIKMFCQEKKLVVIVATQVTKTAAQDMRDGGLIEQEDAQFARSDKFNLVLTVNPIYQGKMLTEEGVINVVKNSLGKSEPVTVYIKPSRLAWLDKRVPKSEHNGHAPAPVRRYKDDTHDDDLPDTDKDTRPTPVDAIADAPLERVSDIPF